MRIKLRIIICATVAIVCSILFHKISSHKRIKAEQMIPFVEVTAAKVTHIRQYISVNGVVRSVRSVNVVSDVSGRIIKILFNSGQYVHQGDLLVVLDDELEKADLEEAEAKLRYQEKNFQRYVQLAKQGIIAKDNLDNLKSQVDQLKARVHRIHAEIEKRFIRAPFDGLLGIKQISQGRYVQPGDLLVNLQQRNSLSLDLTVPEKYINAFSLGQTIQVKEGKVEAGKIVAFDSSINNQTHSLLVRVLIDNKNSTLIPGQFVTAYLPITNKSVITIPMTAINYAASGSSVYVIRKQKAYLQQVELESNDDYAIVKKGLKSGDVVVCAGQAKLFDGSKIKIRMEAKNALH